MKRLLDLFYTWLRTFKNLLLLKCIVLVKFRSFNWILTTFKHKFQSTQPNPNHLRIVTMCSYLSSSVWVFSQLSGLPIQTRRHHTNSVKPTKILRKDLITNNAMEHGELLWNMSKACRSSKTTVLCCPNRWIVQKNKTSECFCKTLGLGNVTR